MAIKMERVNAGNVINAAGNLNKNTRKISSTYNFIKSLVVGIILFFISLFFLGTIIPLGIALMVISLILISIAIYSKKRMNLFLKMQDELMSSLFDDEKVSYFFTDINSQGEISKEGIKNEKENVMILTNKRIIILYIPRLGYGDLTEGNALKNIGRGLAYDGLRKKVESELNSEGLNNMIKDSPIKYSLNYDEISEIKVKNLFRKVIFIYRGKNFKYFIRRDEYDKFKEIFKNYIK
jgi:hypothetical protein